MGKEVWRGHTSTALRAGSARHQPNFGPRALVFCHTVPHNDVISRSTMLNALPAPILLDIAIFFTALSWGLGMYLVDKKLHVFASLPIGCFFCLLGYSDQSLGAPIGAFVAAPIPLDFLRKLAKDVARLRPDLGDLHRVP